MAKLAIVGVGLIIALLVGVSLRPDDGTPFSATPVDAGASVSGTSHAKPLPRVPTVVDVFRLCVAAIVALVLAAFSTWICRLTIRHDLDTRPRPLVSLARARRGPPALV